MRHGGGRLNLIASNSNHLQTRAGLRIPEYRHERKAPAVRRNLSTILINHLYKMYYTYPGSGFFEDSARDTFTDLVNEFGYTIVSGRYERDFVQIIYTNDHLHRKIVIQNAVGYTNYGFSVFIYNLQNNEFNLLYNLPYEKEDLNCEFLKIAKAELFDRPDIVQLISGKNWIKFEKIPFKK